jgi:hypothetical protein
MGGVCSEACDVRRRICFGHFAEQNSMDISYFDISYRKGCLLFLRCSLFGHLCGVKRFGKIDAKAIYCCS